METASSVGLGHPLDRQYPLTDGQVARYRRDGHVLLRELLDRALLEDFRDAIKAAVTRYSDETRPLEERDTYGKAFLQVMNLWERDETVRSFVLAKRFARIAARLMGVNGVRILHDQALFKEPGGGITPWHQDAVYWPLDTDKTITMWMPMADVPAEVGSMTFVSGSHLLDYRRMLAISDQSEEQLAAYIRQNDLASSTYGAMSAGDATWHSGWTMHRAAANPTASSREVMTIIYFAAGARVADSGTSPERDWITEWYSGISSGDELVHERAPLVFP
jgi:ectoine hydroxylase-related dioxygenase (phytanoyl-CoA dioxygenase family)